MLQTGIKTGPDARICIIGAGPSGIAAAKHCLQAGLTNIVVYDRNREVGGNWVYSDDVDHSSVYETAHIISSKRWSQYHDFPMPDHYPDYPSHRLLKEYFQSYARHFGVMDYIRFNTTVTHAHENPDHTWQITLHDGSVETFDHLIVCNGHHWNPRFPSYPGTFSGEIMHSHSYRSHLPFAGKRVLVIGGGNSACDIATDICRHAAFTAISMRRGYYIIPKFVFGDPPDVANARFRWLPFRVRQALNFLIWYLVTGGNHRYGLQKPEHGILEVHPTLNSDLLVRLRHGDIHPRVDIDHYDGQRVVFKDGRSDEYDVIIAATGYIITHPFFDRSFLDFSEGDVPLYLRVFHADHPTLYFVGLVQPQGCIWPLSDTQSQIVANRILGTWSPPADIRERIAAEVDHIRRSFRSAARHTVEVEYHAYQQQLFREVPANAPRWKGTPKPAHAAQPEPA
jgi:cation diffusion facilitator CzcD-associated flavoprotein CzcO